MIYYGARQHGKSLFNKIVFYISSVNRYLQATVVWTRPMSDDYFNDYCYYKYAKKQRKWYKCYNQRMAAKYMVKYYLLRKENKTMEQITVGMLIKELQKFDSESIIFVYNSILKQYIPMGIADLPVKGDIMYNDKRYNDAVMI